MNDLTIKSDLVGCDVVVESWEPGFVFRALGTIREVRTDSRVILVIEVGVPSVACSCLQEGDYPAYDAVMAFPNTEVEFQLLSGADLHENAVVDFGNYAVNFRLRLSGRMPLEMDDDLIDSMRKWLEKRWSKQPSAEPIEEVVSIFREAVSRRKQDSMMKRERTV